MSDGLNIPLNIRSKEAFSKLEKDAKASGAKAGSGLSSEIGNALSVGAGVLGASLLSGAFRKLTGALSDSISAANRQEDAVNSLNIALKSSGRFTEAASKDFQQFASSIQNVSTFGDELILENAALIQSLGQLDQQGLKRATKAAIDLSAALNIDLRSAATLVGKAAVGEVGSFSRYGVAIKKGKDNAETFAKTLDLLEQKFGGAAAGKIETTRGAYTQLANAFGDLTEKLGALITKSTTVRGSIKLLAGAVSDISNALDPQGVAVSDRINQVVDSISLLERQISKFERVGASSSVIESRKKGLELLRLEYAALTKQKKESDAQLAKEQAAIPSPIQEITEEEKQKRLEAIKVIGLSQSQLLDLQYQENLQKLQLAQEADINQTINFNERRLQLEQQYQEAKAALDTTLPLEEQAIQFEGFTAQLEAGLESLAATSKVTGKDVAKSIQQGIGGGAARGFAAFGAAIVKGENALGAFAEALFQSISQQAVALGTSYVLSGTAMLFSPNPKEQAQAPFLIKSGAALAAFGGALGALSGGGAGVGAGGSNQEIDFAQQQPQQIEQEQRQEPQTAVTVNIQGDVLDSEESSLRIAELLQKAVSDQGVRFV